MYAATTSFPLLVRSFKTSTFSLVPTLIIFTAVTRMSFERVSPSSCQPSTAGKPAGNPIEQWFKDLVAVLNKESMTSLAVNMGQVDPSFKPRVKRIRGGIVCLGRVC
ncbi:hypothetical protein COP1_018329 [Malus domestica]